MKSHVVIKALSHWMAVLILAVSTVSWGAGGMDLSQSPEVSVTAKETIRTPKEQSLLPLNYVNQPPMIPHSVDGYQVSINTNRCLQCHGVESYRATGAPRVSPTHFMDASGNVQSGVSAQRYFCLQCHVPQTNATPIIDNTFVPSKGFGK
ncbi:nitrate reductase cytochrome c-type subunit [Phytobacter sp. V91]|uniref:nitrate reductase cytochrome c-type subunit n=1 Tax=Phytobacter sp. V91 TaxID=3369425 RepID=UPI003F621F66